MGCVGDDFEKQNLIELAQTAGLDVKYQTHPKLTTGRCVVLINTKDQYDLPFFFLFVNIYLL